MTTKIKKGAMYLYDGHEYSEQELIDFADTTAVYDQMDNGGEPITTIEQAIAFLDAAEGEPSVQKLAKGGPVIAPESVRGFFVGLDTSKLPTDAAEYINSQVLTDTDIDLLENNDPDFLEVKKLIDESYTVVPPTVTGDDVPNKTGNETVKKLNQEIADLNDLIDMEDDGATISKLKQEIEDLKELISMED